MASSSSSRPPSLSVGERAGGEAPRAARAYEPASPMAPLDEPLDEEDARAFARIRDRGLKISASNLGSLLDVAAASGTGLASPRSPLSPALPTPRGFADGGSGQKQRRAFFGSAEPAAGGGSGNPCFPSSGRSSITKKQMAAMNAAVMQARPSPRHRNASLTHAGDWVEILKALGGAIDETTPLLLRRAAMLGGALNSAAARPEDVARFTAIARDAFENVSNALYVVRREHQKIAFKGSRTRHHKWPAEAEGGRTAGIALLRSMIGQLPVKFAAFSQRLAEMDGVGENYDQTLDKRRLRKAEAYIREAARLLA